jgi:hypothetical protein
VRSTSSSLTRLNREPRHRSSTQDAGSLSLPRSSPSPNVVQVAVAALATTTPTSAPTLFADASLRSQFESPVPHAAPEHAVVLSPRSTPNSPSLGVARKASFGTPTSAFRPAAAVAPLALQQAPAQQAAAAGAASAAGGSPGDVRRANTSALSTIKAAMYSHASSGAAPLPKARGITRTQPLPDVGALLGGSGPDLAHVGVLSRDSSDAGGSPVLSPPPTLERSPSLADSAPAAIELPSSRPASTHPTMPPLAQIAVVRSPPHSPREMLSPRSRRGAASSHGEQPAQEIKRADAQDAFEAKRAANRSAYTRAIVKPANTTDKSPAQEHYYRQMLLGEVLDTELEHLAHMRFVVDKFLLPARQSLLLSEKELASMFGDIEQVCDASAALAAALQARLTAAVAGDDFECIGDAFADVHDKLSAALPDYCVNHEPARLFTEALFAERPAVAEYFETLRRQSESELGPLEAYLIKPVQRVMKYPLLLTELLRYTPADHRDRGALEAAHERSKALAHSINARKRDYEGRRRWAELVPTIEATGDFDLVGHERVLLFEADLTCGSLASSSSGGGGSSGAVSHVGTRRFWLCDDILLCGKPKASGKTKHKMSALFRLAPDASAVATHAAVNDKDLVHCFQVVSFARDAESLVLGFESERTRDEWFGTLQTLLRQAFEKQRALRAQADAKRAPDDRVSAELAIDALDDAQRLALSDAELRQHLTTAFCAFVSSESAFVEQLSMCVRRYVHPLRHLHMQPSELTQLFEAVERIAALHAQRVLPCVASINPNADADVGASEARLQTAVAHAIDELAGNFDAHTQLAQLLDAALAVYERINSPGSPFNLFVNEASQTGTVDDLDFVALLNLPLKRVTEYAALLLRVVLSTRAASLRALVERAAATIGRLSDGQQAQVNQAKLASVARRIQGVPETNPIVSASRRFLAESPMKLAGKPHHVWLFSDRIVYGKAATKNLYKYKGEFDLRDQTLIRNFIDTKAISNAFELVRVADLATTVFAMPDAATKQQWMTAISSTIRERMRAAAAAVTRERTGTVSDQDAGAAAAASAVAAVAAGGGGSVSPPRSPIASPRGQSPLPTRRPKVCEFCFALPPVAKVVFTDGRQPMRTCEACTAILNANPNAKPLNNAGANSATVPRALGMSPPMTTSAESDRMRAPPVRRAQSVFQFAGSAAPAFAGTGRGLLPQRPPRTALHKHAPSPDFSPSSMPREAVRVVVRPSPAHDSPPPLQSAPSTSPPAVPAFVREPLSDSESDEPPQPPPPAPEIFDDDEM